jgi:hypothetical protein
MSEFTIGDGAHRKMFLSLPPLHLSIDILGGDQPLARSKVEFIMVVTFLKSGESMEMAQYDFIIQRIKAIPIVAMIGR